MKVFIAGPRAVSSLDAVVKARLSTIMSKELTILVGDANGIDKAVQTYLNKNQYKNVIVYACNGITRNNIGFWPIKNIPVEKGISGFDFYSRKDAQMAADADCGFMIWNGKSKGTLNDIIALAKAGKMSLVYLTPRKEFHYIKSLDSVERLTFSCGDEAVSLFRALTISTDTEGSVPSSSFALEQISLLNMPLPNAST